VQKENKKMKVTLTVMTKDELINGKRVVEYADKTFNLDMSLGCQMRFEQKFPELAAHEDLISYTTRIKDIKELSLPAIISKLKTVYCYFDTDMTFVQFLKLFDFSNKEYVEKLTNQLTETFEAVYGEASEKNL
jgi:hypothetical protein